MAKYIFLIAIIFGINGCCTKKACSGNNLPAIHVKFKNLLPQLENYVTIYTHQNNVVTDSITSTFYSDFNFITLMPFDTYENNNKSYTLKWNGKTETISDLNCDFFTKRVSCNDCFPFGKDSELIQTFNNFTYNSGSITYNQQDTLVLEW